MECEKCLFQQRGRHYNGLRRVVSRMIFKARVTSSQYKEEFMHRRRWFQLLSAGSGNRRSGSSRRLWEPTENKTSNNTPAGSTTDCRDRSRAQGRRPPGRLGHLLRAHRVLCRRHAERRGVGHRSGNALAMCSASRSSSSTPASTESSPPLRESFRHPHVGHDCDRRAVAGDRLRAVSERRHRYPGARATPRTSRRSRTFPASRLASRSRRFRSTSSMRPTIR